MNHLFVLLSGGGRSSVYGTDPHFDSVSGALRGVRFPLPQADTQAAFHRKPDELHSVADVGHLAQVAGVVTLP